MQWRGRVDHLLWSVAGPSAPLAFGHSGSTYGCVGADSLIPLIGMGSDVRPSVQDNQAYCRLRVGNLSEILALRSSNG